MKDLLHDIVAALLAFLIGLMPAALGAAVSLAYETGLTWGRRFVQLSVGVVTSYFATRVAGAVWPLSHFVEQGVGFVVGMIAYRSVPRFRDGLVEAIAELPGRVMDALPFLKRKDPR